MNFCKRRHLVLGLAVSGEDFDAALVNIGVGHHGSDRHWSVKRHHASTGVHPLRTGQTDGQTDRQTDRQRDRRERTTVDRKRGNGHAHGSQRTYSSSTSFDHAITLFNYHTTRVYGRQQRRASGEGEKSTDTCTHIGERTYYYC